MNSKFYVSLEAARLLKEKGYNEEVVACYNNGEFKPYTPDGYCRIVPMNYNYGPDYMGLFSCPTLLEAMDWLEVRGIRISIKYDWIECGWYYIVIDLTPTVKNITEVEKSDGIFYKDRNECMNEAIKKGLELL